jgi:sigma-B regulation protein RsbU (phosphoserine phosphatase)
LSEDKPASIAEAAAIDYEDLFETAPCGYLLTDSDGRILRANRTFSDWTGLGSEVLAGRRFADLLPIAGKIFYKTHFAPMLHIQGAFDEVALDIVTADGRRVPVLVNAVVRRDGGGNVDFIRLTLFISADRRAYERGLIAQRDTAEASVLAQREDGELREQFIAVLGHDLRNPLAAIASGVRLLNGETLSERGRKILNLMDGSLVRAAGLIDNVLDFARGRLGGGITLQCDAREPLEPVLRQVVAELRAIAPDRTVDSVYDLVEPIDCDRVRIGQLVSNLLGNALTHGAKDEPVRLEARTHNDVLTISITNSGPPISEAALARLFQPFYRGDGGVREQGLGLGLHISSEIARAHGGTLVVSSNAEATVFTFAMKLTRQD